MSILLKGGYTDDGGRPLVEDKWVLRQTAGQPPQAPPVETDVTVHTSVTGGRTYEGQQRESGEQDQSTVQVVRPHTMTADQGEGGASIDNNSNINTNANNKTRDTRKQHHTEHHSSSGSSGTNGYSNGQSAKRSRLTIDSGHSNGAVDKIPL